MRVLVAGLGSIGQRHVRNLRARFGAGIEIVAHRVRGLPHVITDTRTLDTTRSVETTYGITAFESLDEALATKPQAAFICNPTSLHVSTALAAARAGCHLFIEKPLGDDETGIDELIRVVDERQLVATVGYQLRFHPTVRRMRQLLRDGAIGEIVSATAEFAEYLPAAHPYEDYRISYAARTDLGGGVILCYIHEVDYLCWLLGPPRRVTTTGGRLGELEIDVEDTAFTHFEFEQNGRTIPVTLRQTFLQRAPSRMCAIVGTEGMLRVDLVHPSLSVTTSSGTRTEVFKVRRRNQLFADELSQFFAAIDGTAEVAVPLRHAALTLRVALAMRTSLATGRTMEIA